MEGSACMIHIGESSSSLEEWAVELPEAQRVLLQRMQIDPHTYTYSSRPELSFELKLRVNTVGAAVEMAQGRAGFASFAKSKCNRSFWELTDEGGFRLRDNTPAAEAVQDIFKSSSMYAFECAAAIVIVLYKAVLDTIGREAFNTWFKELYIWSWTYDQDLRLIQHRRGRALPGDVRYFDNPDVGPKYPHWQGENVIVLMEEDRYFGHGIGRVSSERIVQVLNRQRKEGATQSAYLLKEITHLDYSYLYYTVVTGQPLPLLHRNPSGELSVLVGNKTYLR
jgi:protein-glutamine gamma-glutamyltransferase